MSLLESSCCLVLGIILDKFYANDLSVTEEESVITGPRCCLAVLTRPECEWESHRYVIIKPAVGASTDEVRLWERWHWVCVCPVWIS